MARQHTVTRSIVRKWADANDQVAVWDWHTEKSFKRSTKLAGSIEGYVPDASGQVAERLWNEEFERGISEVIDSLDDPATVLTDEIADGLRDLLALHYVRSGWMKATWMESLSRGLDSSAQRLAASNLVDIGAGLVLPASPVTVAAAVSRMEEAFTSQQGLEFLAALVKNLERARRELRKYEVQVLTAQDGAGEFVLGDQPAVTWDPMGGRCGMPHGVRLGKTYDLFMPLSPKHVVQLANERSRSEAGPEVVEFVISKQLAGSVEHVYLHPMGDMAAVRRIHDTIKTASLAESGS